MSFNLNDYEPVAVRLGRWLQDCTSRSVRGRVLTELVHRGDDWCVFRAELYEDELLISTGWAEEHQSGRGVNATSHVENCETSAVGRALANAGMAGNDPERRASQEEMRKVKAGSKASRSPSEPPTAPDRTDIPERSTMGRKTPTEAMKKFLAALEKRTGQKAHPDAYESFEVCRSEIDRLQDSPE